MSEKIGVMVCGHGSRDEGAVTEFAQVAKGLRKLMPDTPVEYGYLEFATASQSAITGAPDLSAVLASMATSGSKRNSSAISVMPQAWIMRTATLVRDAGSAASSASARTEANDAS